MAIGIWLLLFSFARAETLAPPPLIAPEAPALRSAVARAVTPWTVSAHFSPVESWVPLKWGASVAWNRSPAVAYELEYSRGRFAFGYWKISLGDVGEDRWSLTRKTFSDRNSFYVQTGIEHLRTGANLGNKYLNSLPGANIKAYELLEVKTLGVQVGFGNRWQSPNGFTWDVNWLSLHMPVILISEHADFLGRTGSATLRREVSGAMKDFRHLPTFAVAKVQMGFSF